MTIMTYLAIADHLAGFTPVQVAVLTQLALHAHKDSGTASWPSLARIAQRTQLGRRTIQRAIKDLFTLGAISLGQQDYPQKKAGLPPSQYQPTVYDIHVNAIANRGATAAPLPEDTTNRDATAAPLNTETTPNRGATAAPLTESADQSGVPDSPIRGAALAPKNKENNIYSPYSPPRGHSQPDNQPTQTKTTNHEPKPAANVEAPTSIQTDSARQPHPQATSAPQAQPATTGARGSANASDDDSCQWHSEWGSAAKSEEQLKADGRPESALVDGEQLPAPRRVSSTPKAVQDADAARLAAAAAATLHAAESAEMDARMVYEILRASRAEYGLHTDPLRPRDLRRTAELLDQLRSKGVKDPVGRVNFVIGMAFQARRWYVERVTSLGKLVTEFWHMVDTLQIDQQSKRPLVGAWNA